MKYSNIFFLEYMDDKAIRMTQADSLKFQNDMILIGTIGLRII